jgi:hypothetical protein
MIHASGDGRRTLETRRPPGASRYNDGELPNDAIMGLTCGFLAKPSEHNGISLLKWMRNLINGNLRVFLGVCGGCRQV